MLVNLGFGPDERLGVLIIGLDEGVDVLSALGDRCEGGASTRASSTARSSGVSRTSAALGIIPMLNHESRRRKGGY
jgi:hypothetical protein